MDKPKPKKLSTFEMLKNLDKDVQSDRSKKDSSSKYKESRKRRSVSPKKDYYESKSSSRKTESKKPKVQEITIEDDDDIDYDIPDRSYGDLYCKACDSHMNSEQMWEAHIQGKRHQKHIKKWETADQRYDVKSEDAIFQADARKSDKLLIGLQHCCEIQRPEAKPIYQCFLCSANLPNSSQLVDHVIGIKHRMGYLKEHDPVKHDLIAKTDLKKGMIEPVVEECIQMHFDKYGCGRLQVKFEKPKPKTAKEQTHGSFHSNNNRATDFSNSGSHFKTYQEKFDVKYGPVSQRKDRASFNDGGNDKDPKYNNMSPSPRRRYDDRSPSPRRRYNDRSPSPRRRYDDRLLSPQVGFRGYPDSDLPYDRPLYPDDLDPRYGRDDFRFRERALTPPYARQEPQSSLRQFPDSRPTDDLHSKSRDVRPQSMNMHPNPSDARYDTHTQPKEVCSQPSNIHLQSSDVRSGDLRNFLDQRKAQEQNRPQNWNTDPTSGTNLLESLLKILDNMPNSLFLEIVLHRVEKINPTDEEIGMLQKIGNHMISLVMDKKLKKLSPDMLNKYQQSVGSNIVPSPAVDTRSPVSENKSSNLNSLMDLISYFKTTPQDNSLSMPAHHLTNPSNPGNEPAFMTQSSVTFFNAVNSSPQAVSIPGLTLSANSDNNSFEQSQFLQSQSDAATRTINWNNLFNKY